MVATAVLSEDQTGTSGAVEVSEYVPVAENCWVDPIAMLAASGARAMDCNVALVTVSELVPVMLPRVAVIVELPGRRPFANPVLSIVATPVYRLDQLAPLTTPVELSEYVPVATNCCVPPAAIDAGVGVAPGVTLID